MGMFDNVYVDGSNKVGIPAVKDYYQTKDLDSLLVGYYIDENGKLSIKHKGMWEERYEEETRLGEFTEVMCIYGDAVSGSNVDLFLYIEDNQVKFVFDYKTILYKAEEILVSEMYEKFDGVYCHDFSILKAAIEKEKA